MAQEDNGQDERATDKDEVAAARVVESITSPDPTDKMQMHVSEDGVVTFGDADPRGEKRGKVGDDDDDDAPVEGEHAGMTAAEVEALRAKRRLEKKRRREAAKERESLLRSENASLKAQVEQLAGRVNQIDQRTNTIDTARLDEEIGLAKAHYEHWRGVLEQAVTSQNGKLAVEATEKMQEAKDYGVRAVQLKQQATQAPARSGVDPSIQSHLDAWRARPENAWYNPLAPDEDTEIALLVDKPVARAGFKPQTKEFWDELDRRLKKRLPHRYQDAGQDSDDPDESSTSANSASGSRNSAGSSTTRRVPAAGGGNQGATGGAPRFVLSKERIEAMKAGGIWNDPKKKEAQIRAFMKWDRENPKGGR